MDYDPLENKRSCGTSCERSPVTEHTCNNVSMRNKMYNPIIYCHFTLSKLNNFIITCGRFNHNTLFFINNQECDYMVFVVC